MSVQDSFALNASGSGADLGEGVSYTDYVIGAAIFDLNGLPKEYFTTGENDSIGWVQTIFQALGLRSLLMSSLQLEGFQHAVIHGVCYTAVVVKQHARYTALLVSQNYPTPITYAFIRWLQDLEPNALRTNARFRVA